MKTSHLSIIAAIALGVGFTLSWMLQDAKPVKLEAGRWFGEQAMDLPEFQLTDHNSRAFGKADLAGQWGLMFFGFTHCPDICPISLQTLGEMLEAIEDESARRQIRVVFVSVDPDRDTPPVLKQYVSYFHPEIVGASGSLEQLNRLTSVLGIAHSRDKLSEDQALYNVSHSSAIILTNPDTQYAGLFSAPHNGLAMARDLVKIIDNN